MNRTFCFVPVRKGSRGIPGKNLRLLGDKPLYVGLSIPSLLPA